MKAAFWRFAHRHYHGKSLSRLPEFAALVWGLLFTFVYGAALLAGWWPTVPEAFVGALLTFAPLTFCLVHRRVRLEASKGPDALYRKRVQTTR